ncbi:hypothetical protein SAMN02745174_01630 [Cetobacterium ceti]|uniref:Uncharacterized protein n=1 Tax=Cetobacterium ceti TaxID=180163 RepID=A0A1T4NQH9_9FUSO|nr:hypothetical protein [Cetobacterium ceti]SJZ81452.1 hypothetical protein SAMN02745174_01630 [Cetobacterium ceti]
MIKNIDTIISELDMKETFDTILIDYEKENGISISKETKEFQSLKEASPYKFYIFNDSVMVYGVKIDDNEYFVEEIRANDFSNGKVEVIFFDEKEISKVSGYSNERKIRFRKGLINGVEKIQFIGLEG